jgi:hypothetical protein
LDQLFFFITRWTIQALESLWLNFLISFWSDKKTWQI